MTDDTTKSPQGGEIAASYWTPEELAEGLGVTVRTLNRWHRLRQGPPMVKLGQFRVYRREAVHQWLADREIREPRRRA